MTQASTANVAHTPGPWIARMQRSKDGRDLGWIIETERGDRIGWSSYADIATNQGDLPQSGPNARLIAAAPELLAFVKNISRAASFPWTEQAIALIAKAEGRES